MTATRPQGAPAPQELEGESWIECWLNKKVPQQFDGTDGTSVGETRIDREGMRQLMWACIEDYISTHNLTAPLAERRGQGVEKRIRAACDDYFRTGSTEALDDVLRRHFADLGASQQFSSTNIEGGRRFKQVLPNEDVGAQQQCTDRVEVPRRWVIAVNEFIEDWQKGDFNLPQLAALDAQAIIEAGADGPDLEACLNCGTDHSKGECRVVAAPAPQSNPAPPPPRLSNFMGIAGDQSNESRALAGKGRKPDGRS